MKYRHLSLLFIFLTSIFLTIKAKSSSEYSSSDKLSSEQPSQEVTIDRFNWSGKLPTNKLVIVKNEFGDISSRTIKKKSLLVQAIYQQIGDNAPKPDIQINENNGTTEITVKYPMHTINNQRGERIARTDIAIYLPEGIQMQLDTSFGNIKAKKHYSDINATTDNGNISVSTIGKVNLQSHSGNIFLSLKGEKWKGEQQIKSSHGDITLLLPKKLDLELQVSSGQGISSNFETYKIPFQQDNQFELNAKFATASSLLRSQSETGKTELIYYRRDNVDIVNSVGHFDGDIRNLPKTKAWQPGDPIIEKDDRHLDNSQDDNPDVTVAKSKSIKQNLTQTLKRSKRQKTVH